MSQVVEADLRLRRLLQKEQEAAHQIAREERSTELIAKDEIAVAPPRAIVRTLPFLALLVATKHLDHRRCQRNLAAAPAGLRLLLDPLALFTFQLHAYPQQTFIQLDIPPARPRRRLLPHEGLPRARPDMTTEGSHRLRARRILIVSPAWPRPRPTRPSTMFQMCSPSWRCAAPINGGSSPCSPA